MGRQLQRDDDEERLARYKARMRAQAVKYEEEVALRKRYCEEMTFLRSQLEILKDEVLAAQTAYEELAISITTSGSPSSSNDLPAILGALDEYVSAPGSWDADTEDDFYALQQMQIMSHEIDCDDVDQLRFNYPRCHSIKF
jgi:hypothetical protein